jgi:hypothetical protein
MALSQEVAVLQGPPGTGKTFLGVALTRLLLRCTRNAHALGGDAVGAAAAAREALPEWARGEEPGVDPPGPLPDVGPILLVTFTNHALDSFLLGLLDAGVRARLAPCGAKGLSRPRRSQGCSGGHAACGHG